MDSVLQRCDNPETPTLPMEKVSERFLIDITRGRADSGSITANRRMLEVEKRLVGDEERGHINSFVKF
jgi:hypothetical protein